MVSKVINVKVNNDAKPVPYHSQGKGNTRITWKLKDKNYHFTGLKCLPDPPFSDMKFSKDGKTMSVANNNRGTKTIDYEYIICIALDKPSDTRKKRGAGKAVIRNEP